MYALSFLVGKHHDPQSVSGKLFLPITPIGIAVYALTLLWDNLCMLNNVQCKEMKKKKSIKIVLFHV